MKILIAGLGSIGRRHLRNLQVLGVQDILLYRTHQSSLPDDELRHFPQETDLAAALDHDPDAVIISNPTALHLEIALAAAQRGCHLLIEKPISHTLEGVEQLQNLVEQNGCRVLIGYHFRFHPGLLKIKEMLQHGMIGRPLIVRAHWGEYLPAWHPWEDYRRGYSARADLGGGLILTLSHPLDYLRWLFGDVNRVFAAVDKLGDLEIQVEDTAEICLWFANGSLGSVHLDYLQRPPHHNLQIIGTRGTIEWEYANGETRLYRFDQDRTTQAPLHLFPSFSPLDPNKPLERNDLFLAEMQHFLAVVEGRESPRCTLEDGIEALRIALSAYQSAKQGRVVELATW
jgi:predicted dehydrogenase